MTIKTENYQINKALTLYYSATLPLVVYAINLSLTRNDSEIIQNLFTFQVNLELYQHIDTNALFNLNPVVRISPPCGDFQPELPIQMEASLKPDLFPHLAEKASNIEELVTYILSQTAPDPLLMTENWLGLSVKQFQSTGEVGYHTFWEHFNELGRSMASDSQEQFAENITHFFQDLVSRGLDTSTQDIAPASLGEVADFFKDLTATLSDSTFQSPDRSQPIFEEIINFFTEDDWQFQPIQEETTLRLAFQGSNGRLNCFAQTRETQHQFLFYSVCPMNAPEDKRSAIAEFLTRANYGMAIGNFELDYTDGEIRYKTSIDVEGDRLTPALIKTIVYTNVSVMDEYLPGIRAVIKNDVLPSDAIAAIEQPDSIEPLNLADE